MMFALYVHPIIGERFKTHKCPENSLQTVPKTDYDRKIEYNGRYSRKHTVCNPTVSTKGYKIVQRLGRIT